jgi:hypothetical protein
LGPLRLLAHWLVSIACLLLHSHCFLLDNQIHFRPDFFSLQHTTCYMLKTKQAIWVLRLLWYVITELNVCPHLSCYNIQTKGKNSAL